MFDPNVIWNFMGRNLCFVMINDQWTSICYSHDLFMVMQWNKNNKKKERNRQTFDLMTLFASWITTTSNDSMGFTSMRGKNEEKKTWIKLIQRINKIKKLSDSPLILSLTLLNISKIEYCIFGFCCVNYDDTTKLSIR